MTNNLSQALTTISKKYGKEAVWKASDKALSDVEVIPTGNIALDIALGVGGYARGRIIEIYGPESSGKTTLTLHAIAEAQKDGGIAVFIDAEHALDPNYASNLGVNMDSLYICQPDYAEQGLEIALEFVETGDVSLVVIDSVAALTPLAEIRGDIGDSHVGLQARLMSQTMRKITGAAQRTNTSVIFINQIREKIGVMFGSPETTPGGRALKFYASQRLDIRRIESIKEDSDIVGNRTRVKVVKNKVAPPFRQAEFDIIYGKGISQSRTILDLAVDLELVKKSGAWYYDREGNQLGQGKNKAALALEENTEFMAELYDAIMIEYFGEKND